LLRDMKQTEYKYPTSAAEYDSEIEHHITYPPEDSIGTNFW